MDQPTLDKFAAWLVTQGLAGTSEDELLQRFCPKLRSYGVDISRVLMLVDTLHPVYEGRAFRWHADDIERSAVTTYGRTNEGEAATEWQNSIFYRMLADEQDERHLLLGEAEPMAFRNLAELQMEGHTAAVVMIQRFAEDGAIGELDSIYSYWCTRTPGGFKEADRAVLRRLVPILALSIKSASLARIAGTLVEVYLGRDAGQRVLAGRIQRGIAEPISAVLWFSDLRGFTRITESAAPDEIIPMLNDYADAVISAVHEAGGDVLKLIGDGTLAIFKADDAAQACRCALDAEADLRKRLVVLNAARAEAGRPVTSVYLGLHIGQVFYGNIGSAERLDFTVVGPAVNEASRIASMCRSADRDVLLSADFVGTLDGEARERFISVGRYGFRGVERARELFTIDRD